MIINKMKIKNFRQFKDAEIIFSSKPYGITLVTGSGGSGKTTVVNALKWGLSCCGKCDYSDDDIVNRGVLKKQKLEIK